eukprot:549430_1
MKLVSLLALLGFICINESTPRPTPKPTPKPTSRPTNPTPKPTARPTSPTPKPTYPTPKPTYRPTLYGETRSPTSPTYSTAYPTYPTSPTSRATASYQYLSVWYNITNLESDTASYLGNSANDVKIKWQIDDATESGIDAASSASMSNVEAGVRDLKLNTLSNRMDVWMQIDYYYTEKYDVRRSQDSNNNVFEQSIQTDLRYDWSDNTLKVNVHTRSIRVTSNASVLYVVGCVFTVVISLVL